MIGPETAPSACVHFTPSRADYWSARPQDPLGIRRERSQRCQNGSPEGWRRVLGLANEAKFDRFRLTGARTNPLWGYSRSVASTPNEAIDARRSMIDI